MKFFGKFFGLFSETPEAVPHDTSDVEAVLAESQDRLHRRIDHLFAVLFIFQWILGAVLALVVTPRTWIGATSQIHIHVWAALFLGFVIISIPLYLIKTRPGKPETRQTIAVAQALTGVFLIHLTGGRIETHFHVFGSLAFIAMYRDWRVLITMTVIVAVDHILRGILWPQSVYGVFSAQGWRWLEHAAWVIFEDIFLILSIKQSQMEMRTIAERQVELTQLNQALDEKVAQRTEQVAHLQAGLIQSEKMASLGQLAAGVAHEINNPIGFVMSNLNTLHGYIGTLKKILASYGTLGNFVQSKYAEADQECQDLIQNVHEIEKQDRVAFILGDIDSLVSESQEGTERVKNIVQGLKSFARIDTADWSHFNVNTGIQDTLKIAWNELKYKCQVNLELGELPDIWCNPGQLNQVILNLLVNAAHAIPEQGSITIRTEACDTYVMIQVADTGGGIAPENLSRIFDPFFTTKPVGQGTGLGLAISYGIITKHQGTLEVESDVGKGTTFTIKLPIRVDLLENQGIPQDEILVTKVF